MAKVVKRAFWVVLSIFGLIFLMVLAINVYMIQSTKKYIFNDISKVPERYTVIVPGAMVYKNNVVSHVFRDRIEAGVGLLQTGNVSKILISGDHGRKDYDEVNAAKSYIKTMHNLDLEKIFLDHAGFNTYSTMYRARDVFCVQDAVITTQKFHIYRSVYIARALGIDAVGYISPEITRFRKSLRLNWELRESLARVKAFFSVCLHAKPKYLGNQIPITGSGALTWDM
ncbi:SanA/YdcF family protein [Treponema zioleckii]|uniref:SanA/YdcF family protein n=1 Tax=Treponema zioleckii TaxID=331680 RepID=UPI00168B699F|nr:ElyC/SanA/YdcF family protein [Treponema zioleckii]